MGDPGMQALSRRQQMHPLTMLFLGASIAFVCWLPLAAIPAWAQSTDASIASIRTLKGAGPIEYAPSTAGIQLRLLKGVQRTDYVLRPRLAAQNPASPKRPRGEVTPAPAPRTPEKNLILRTNVNLPTGGTAANNTFPSRSVLLPPIQETHQASPPPYRLANAEEKTGQPWFPNSVWEPSSRNSVSRGSSDAGEGGAKRSFADGVPKQSLGTRKEAPVANAPGSPPAPHSAASLPVPQRQDGQDWPDRKALYDIALLHVIGTVSAALLVSAAMVVSVVVLLRRLRGQMPAFVRVEAPSAAPSSPAQLEMPPAPVSFVEESTAEPFDLGPTCEEERLLKEAAQRQQEQAVLRTIFEDNLKLRQQLMELEAAAA
jgi:hypothetical protein